MCGLHGGHADLVCSNAPPGYRAAPPAPLTRTGRARGGQCRGREHTRKCRTPPPHRWCPPPLPSHSSGSRWRASIRPPPPSQRAQTRSGFPRGGRKGGGRGEGSRQPRRCRRHHRRHHGTTATASHQPHPPPFVVVIRATAWVGWRGRASSRGPPRLCHTPSTRHKHTPGRPWAATAAARASGGERNVPCDQPETARHASSNRGPAQRQCCGVWSCTTSASNSVSACWRKPKRKDPRHLCRSSQHNTMALSIK